MHNWVKRSMHDIFVSLQLDVSHRVLRTETVRDFLNGLVKRGVQDLKTEAEKGLLGVSVLTRLVLVILLYFIHFSCPGQ